MLLMGKLCDRHTGPVIPGTLPSSPRLAENQIEVYDKKCIIWFYCAQNIFLMCVTPRK